MMRKIGAASFGLGCVVIVACYAFASCGGSAGGSDHDVDAALIPLGPRINLVVASPDLGEVRVCFKAPSGFVAGADAPVPAPPETSLKTGTGAPVYISNEAFSKLTGVELTPYVVKADATGSCTEIVGAGTTANVVATLPAVPANTFASGKSYVAAIIGCFLEGTYSGDCGGGPRDLRTPGLQVIEVDSSTIVPAGSISAQFIELYLPGYANLFSGAGILSAEFTSGGDDAGAAIELLNSDNNIQYGGPPEPSPALPISLSKKMNFTIKIRGGGPVASSLDVMAWAVPGGYTGQDAYFLSEHRYVFMMLPEKYGRDRQYPGLIAFRSDFDRKAQ